MKLHPVRESDAQLPLERLLDLYARMVLVRRLEEALGRAHAQGQIKGPLHRCDGQEAVGIGVTSALRETDTVMSTHRGHAHYVGKGVDLKRMVAEIMGRATGYGLGRAGHMLVGDARRGLLGGNGIVGGSIPIAVGAALAHRNLRTGGVAVAFFGDGALNSGSFNESLNMAALWTLPVVFVCENNQYALTVHVRRHLAHLRIVDRAAGYGMPGEEVAGNDVEAVVVSTARAVARAREGGGPSFLVADTYRRTGFSTSDIGGYQPGEEAERWPDPLQLTRDRLLERGALESQLAEVDVRANAQVDEAIAFGLGSPFPTPAEALPDA
jgi:acetoin:2,6-dichlorophenolindophenol oxidoreductase subunit alpha